MKYWAYINNEILGPFEKEKLLELPAFGASALICPQTPVGEKTEDWKEASTYPEVAALLTSLPSGSVSLQAQPPAAGPAITADAPSTQDQPAQLSPAPMTVGEATMSKYVGDTPRKEEPGLPAPAASAAEAPASEAPAPAAETAKPAEAASPASPAPQNPLGNIELTHFGELKGSGKIEHPATELAKAASAGFEPVSLSQSFQLQSQTRTEAPVTPAAAETPAGSGTAGKTADSASTPPQAAPLPEIKFPQEPAKISRPPDFSDPGVQEAPQALRPISEYNPAARVTPASNPAGTPAGHPAGGPSAAELEALSAKIQAIGEKTLTGPELTSQLEPLKQKLEHVDAALASTSASQFQRDLFVKLGYLETAVAEIKTAIASIAKEKAAARTAAPMEKKPEPARVAQTPLKAEKPHAEKAHPEEPKKEERQASADFGKKMLRLKIFMRKFLRFVVTLVLLAAVALVAVFALKQAEIFDATKFIPFHIPFLTQPKADDETGESASENPDGAGAEVKTAPEKTKTPDAVTKAANVPPEVIYFLRTYALRPGGLTLENAIRQEAAKAGWDADRLEWEGKAAAEEGDYELAAVIPSKTGGNKLAFTYAANAKEKTVKPLDETGKAVMESLIAAAAVKKQPAAQSRSARPAAKKAAAAPRAQSRKAPARQAAPEEEYEYVEEEAEE